MERDNTKGREENSAQPLGAQRGTESDKDVRRVGREETKTAVPDGPDARAVGDIFKKRP